MSYDGEERRAEDDYARGVREGRVNARLDQHDEHFAEINGSIREMKSGMVTLEHTVTSGLHALTIAVHGLVQGAEARDRTTLATAAALEKADAARRVSDEEKRVVEDAERTNEVYRSARRWTPFSRGLAVFAALATTVGLWISYLALRGGTP